MDYIAITTDNYLEHHGILGQKWGIRRYQNADGSLTEAGKKRIERQDRQNRYNMNEKDYSEYLSNKLKNKDTLSKTKFLKEEYKEMEQANSDASKKIVLPIAATAGTAGAIAAGMLIHPALILHAGSLAALMTGVPLEIGRQYIHDKKKGNKFNILDEKFRDLNKEDVASKLYEQHRKEIEEQNKNFIRRQSMINAQINQQIIQQNAQNAMDNHLQFMQTVNDNNFQQQMNLQQQSMMMQPMFM